MKTYKLLAFDADGTLRKCTVPGQPCPNRPGEWELLPGVREKLATIDWTATDFAIVSNQGGVGLGILDAAIAKRVLEDTALAALEGSNAIRLGVIEATILLCPHAPKAGCPCRKPQPGLLFQIMVQFDVSPADVLYVGDQDSDRIAAERAGVDFMWARDFFGWSEGS